MKVSAIIVTRGDVGLSPIIGSMPPAVIDEVIVWDNSQRDDLSVYGRYAAIAEAKNELIFVQDDDCVLPPGSFVEIVGQWKASASFGGTDHVVCNMPARFRDQPQYERGDSALVGFGACFHRDAPKRAFDFYSGRMGIGPTDSFIFGRTCDIIFTGLTPRVLVDAPYEDLPHAHAENRMWKQPQHVAERMRMLELVRSVRDAS